jgi:hypothetical protein
METVLILFGSLVILIGIGLAMREPPEVFERPEPDTDPPEVRMGR